MKKILFLLVAAIFCLPIKADPPRNLHQFAIGAENINKRENRYMIDQAKGTKYAYARGQVKYAAKHQQPRTTIKHAIEVVIDEVTGITTVRWDDGSTYVGETYYGEIKGTGTMTFADGSKYQGQWKNDRFHGVGTFEYADGSAYCGQWENGDPYGYGTFINADGVKYTAKFDEGIPSGKCIIQDVDGCKYTGRWSSGILLKRSIKPYKEKK